MCTYLILENPKQSSYYLIVLLFLPSVLEFKKLDGLYIHYYYKRRYTHKTTSSSSVPSGLFNRYFQFSLTVLTCKPQECGPIWMMVPARATVWLVPQRTAVLNLSQTIKETKDITVLNTKNIFYHTVKTSIIKSHIFQFVKAF